MRPRSLTLPLALLLLTAPAALPASQPAPIPDRVIAHLKDGLDEALFKVSEGERGMARAREYARQAADAHDEKHRIGAEALGDYCRFMFLYACRDRDRLSRALATARALALLPAARFRNTLAAVSVRSGGFEHLRPREGALVPVGTDEPASLECGDILRIGNGAVVDLTPFVEDDEDAPIALGPGSALEVLAPPADRPDDLPSLVLAHGALHFAETSGPDKPGPTRTRRVEAIAGFLVRTRSHVLIPRSGEYLLECPPDGPSRLTVPEGAVLVLNPATGAATLVEAETCVRLAPDAWPPTPVDYAPDRDGWWSRLDLTE